MTKILSILFKKGRRLKMILFLLVLVVSAYFYISYKIGYNPLQNTSILVKDNKNTLVESLIGELGTYKRKESEEKLRQLELKRLQNPALILSECKKKGELLIYEGKATYADLLQEETWASSKTLNLDLKYNFGIVFDLRSIRINGFHDKTVVVDIPVNELRLKYLELDAGNAHVKSDISLFASQYTPQEMKSILDNAYIYTKNDINNNKDVFQEAKYGLEDALRELILKLKYEVVIFQDIK